MSYRFDVLINENLELLNLMINIYKLNFNFIVVYPILISNINII